jgi:hypothetical protein
MPYNNVSFIYVLSDNAYSIAQATTSLIFKFKKMEFKVSKRSKNLPDIVNDAQYKHAIQCEISCTIQNLIIVHTHISTLFVIFCLA